MNARVIVASEYDIASPMSAESRARSKYGGSMNPKLPLSALLPVIALPCAVPSVAAKRTTHAAPSAKDASESRHCIFPPWRENRRQRPWANVRRYLRYPGLARSQSASARTACSERSAGSS